MLFLLLTVVIQDLWETTCPAQGVNIEDGYHWPLPSADPSFYMACFLNLLFRCGQSSKVKCVDCGAVCSPSLRCSSLAVG